MICAACAKMSVFAEDMTLRKATEEEIASVYQIHLQRVVRLALRAAEARTVLRSTPDPDVAAPANVPEKRGIERG